MNKMSAHGVTAFGVVVAILMLVRCAEAQIQHIVGDNLGWKVPQGNTSAYQTWATNNKFAVGDALLFNFQTNQHDVVEVPKDSYDSCSSDNPIGRTITTGPTTIALATAGNHYYICTIGQHCQLGQKLAINVSGSPGALPPSTATPPAATTTPPAAPSPSSAASGCGFVSFPLFFLSAFVAMVF